MTNTKLVTTIEKAENGYLVFHNGAANIASKDGYTDIPQLETIRRNLSTTVFSTLEKALASIESGQETMEKVLKDACDKQEKYYANRPPKIPRK